jgi:hypothetical protein
MGSIPAGGKKAAVVEQEQPTSVRSKSQQIHYRTPSGAGAICCPRNASTSRCRMSRERHMPLCLLGVFKLMVMEWFWFETWPMLR